MRIGLLGATSAEEAFAAARRGQERAAALTSLVDTPSDNGFPGFAAIWERAWGALPGILAPSNTIASTTPHVVTAAPASAMPMLLAAGLALGGIYLINKPKRRR